MQSNIHMVKLGDVLTLSKISVPIDPLAIYKQVTIKMFHKGLVLREEKIGQEIQSNQWLVKQNQFVISRIDARNGAMGIVPHELDGAIVTNDFLRYDINQDRLDVKFFDFLTNTENFVNQCARSSEGTTNRKRLRPDLFLEIEIPLPSLEKQQRIVVILERLITKIENIREERKRAIADCEHLFSKNFLKIFDESSEWNLIPIEECCQNIIDYRGRTPPISDAGIPHITTANIKNGTIDWNTSKFVLKEIYDIYMTRGIPKKDDVLFTMEAPLGETAIIPDNRIFSIAQRILLLRTNVNLIEGSYLSKMLMHPLIRAKILKNGRTTTVSGISSKKLKQITIPVPTIPEQRRIVAHLDRLQAKVDEVKRLQAETEKEIEALIPAVLAKAFGS